MKHYIPESRDKRVPSRSSKRERQLSKRLEQGMKISWSERLRYSRRNWLRKQRSWKIRSMKCALSVHRLTAHTSLPWRVLTELGYKIFVQILTRRCQRHKSTHPEVDRKPKWVDLCYKNSRVVKKPNQFERIPQIECSSVYMILRRLGKKRVKIAIVKPNSFSMLKLLKSALSNQTLARLNA